MKFYQNPEMLILTSIHDSIVNGKTQVLNELGLEAVDLALMKELSALNINHLNIKTKLINKIELDRQAVNALLLSSIQLSKQNDMIESLIRGGASNCMLTHYFGVTKREFSQLRKSLGVTTRCRVPRSISNRTNSALRKEIITSVNNFINKSERGKCIDSLSQCGVILYISESTSKPLPIIWSFINDAERRGEFYWHK